MTNWHRLFGLFLMDFFTNSPYKVELEKDLSLKQQFLDVVILRKEQGGFTGKLPDGLDNLTAHNLLSYKSLHEPLDGWAIKELIGHYVNYRKQVSPSVNQLYPESQFQLYGISTRFPKKLEQQVPLQRINQGIYEINWGADNIRIIVLSEIPDGEHNAIWRLFSAKREDVLEAREQYHIHQTDMSTIVQQLFEKYQQERIDMTYTVQDFQKDYVLDHLNIVSADEVLKRYSPDEVLKRYSPDEVLKRYSSDERLKDLSPDERLKDLSPDEILGNLSPESLKILMEKLGKQ